MKTQIRLPKIGAVVFAGYPGQESGNAIADILWGNVNPSGKVCTDMTTERVLICEVAFHHGKGGIGLADWQHCQRNGELREPLTGWNFEGT